MLYIKPKILVHAYHTFSHNSSQIHVFSTAADHCNFISFPNVSSNAQTVRCFVCRCILAEATDPAYAWIRLIRCCSIFKYFNFNREAREALVESLGKTCTRYRMEISAEKTKLMTNSANATQREIKVKEQKLGTVTSFKNLGAVVSDDGSKQRIVQATAALTKLKPIWRDNNLSLESKVKLMRSLVISIFLYACES